MSMAELQPWAGACTPISHPQVLFHVENSLHFGKTLWDFRASLLSLSLVFEPSPG